MPRGDATDVVRQAIILDSFSSIGEYQFYMVKAIREELRLRFGRDRYDCSLVQTFEALPFREGYADGAAVCGQAGGDRIPHSQRDAAALPWD